MKCGYSFPALLILAGLAPITAFAGGYSSDMNEKIWALRLEAQEHVSRQAAQECGWSPHEPLTFSDQIDPANKARDGRLFGELMAMLRLDQNARAVSTALDDDESRAMTKAVDAENLVPLKTLIATRGFPSTDAVGEQGVNAALMLVAHADQDLGFQKDVLKMMEREASDGLLSPTIPMVLKGIRPQIVDEKMPSGAHAVDQAKAIGQATGAEPRPRPSANPSLCYTQRYSELVDVFLAEHVRVFIRTGSTKSGQSTPDMQREQPQDRAARH